MTPAERAFAQFTQRVKPSPGLSAPQRYLLAIAMLVGAEVCEWLFWDIYGPPTTFIGLFVTILASSRFLGTGPTWLTVVLATLDLAYDLPMDGRFFGIVGTYIAIMLFRIEPFSGGSEFRRRGKRPRVGKYILLARDRLSALVRLSQNSIKQRRAAEQRPRPISIFDAAR